MKMRSSLTVSLSCFSLVFLFTFVEPTSSSANTNVADYVIKHWESEFAELKKQIKEISMAKNFACMVSDRVTYDAVQIHGGFGYMREYLVERLYRDNRILSIGGGTQEIMKEIISRHLLP